MGIWFYSRLVLNGMRGNRRLYAPYVLTGGVMVAIYYVLDYLVNLPLLLQMRGGTILQEMLSVGLGVIAIFSALFMYYTDAFMVRQRSREFGLYHVLGMGKGNLAVMMALEKLVTGAVAIVGGLVTGIALSKGAELVLLNLIHQKVSFDLAIDTMSVLRTGAVYGGIYLLLLGVALVRAKMLRPLEWMTTAQKGEKIPRRIWPATLLGFVLLGGAYYFAATVESPLSALSVFFVAVVAVMMATYLLMMSGSVVLCRLLQKNKKYYYNKRHYVSVSSMAFRMRRNGAGLASICILMTMVLVMISSTASLYAGAEDSIVTRYPRGINVGVGFDSAVNMESDVVKQLQQTIQPYAGQAQLDNWCDATVAGMFTDAGLTAQYSGDMAVNYNKVGFVNIISLSDYNRQTGQNTVLQQDECLIYPLRMEYTGDTFSLNGGTPYRIKQVLKDYPHNGNQDSLITPTLYLIVPDVQAATKDVAQLTNSHGNSLVSYHYYCQFDVPEEQEEECARQLKEKLDEFQQQNPLVYYNMCESRQANRQSFFETYGGLLFLGLALSAVFLIAAVLIIYYKQLSEGYEDCRRFAILQKVGMSRRDIKSSVNSQVLTLFFSPLILAGTHLIFSYFLVQKMLMLFGFTNGALVAVVMLLCYGAVGLFYLLVYKLTAGSYYRIVSGQSSI